MQRWPGGLEAGRAKEVVDRGGKMGVPELNPLDGFQSKMGTLGLVRLEARRGTRASGNMEGGGVLLFPLDGWLGGQGQGRMLLSWHQASSKLAGHGHGCRRRASCQRDRHKGEAMAKGRMVSKG